MDVTRYVELSETHLQHLQYQPLVFILLTLGTHTVNIRYAYYQRLVFCQFLYTVKVRSLQDDRNSDWISMLLIKHITVYTKLGNGTETTYTYDKRRERLQEMNLTAAGISIMHNKYQYDSVDNILGITNAVDPTRGNTNGDKKLGGAFKHSYAYDDLNRLVYASGKAKQASYSMQMTFGRMSEPLTKIQKVDSTKTAQSYGFTYKYEDSNHLTAPTQIGHEHYTYDANGNPTLVENDSLNTERRMYWDEDNRLMVLSDNGKTSRYTYNAAGERIIKSHGDLEGVYINGAPQGITFHETEDYTIYPAPIITVTKNRFTKHYFIGDKRVASKLGVGRFSNVYGISGNNVTAGQKDYATRMMQIEKQREEYYKSLGTPPGVPTMKGATADPDNTGRGYNDIIGDLGDHSVPEGWVQRPKFNEKGDVPGPPIQWQKPEDPDNAQPGYGYVPTDTTNIEDIFFYHSDHLGSTSYITDANANITQFDAYLPYGELLVDEHTSSEEMPYKFNGKELDQETGLYYYGARYMNPRMSVFLNIDRFADKYPFISPYVYCRGNPINYIDINGDTLTVISSQGEYLFTLDNHQKNHTKITARDLYELGTQWFESSADNYMPLLYVNANLKRMNSLKHFTWDDIISFSEIDRSMWSYHTGGDGDWKAKGKPGDGYLMVEVDGVPYWTDAIGQIPYALNEYRNEFRKSKNSEFAAGRTLELGQQFGNGSLWNLLFPSPDTSNSYDNAMIKRATDWAKNRYSLSPVRTSNGGYEIGVVRKDYSPANMRVYTIKKNKK